MAYLRVWQMPLNYQTVLPNVSDLPESRAKASDLPEKVANASDLPESVASGVEAESGIFVAGVLFQLVLRRAIQSQLAIRLLDRVAHQLLTLLDHVHFLEDISVIM